MPRANRYIVSGSAYHLTHRCHDRAFLLKFARHRDRYREILREELAGRSVALLSYTITCNHVHLLVAEAGPDAIARFMQAAQGRFAEEYNRLKGRQGAFWSDRYHATVIDSGEHLWACLKYIDLNMVRAGVVKHPQEWDWTAWPEFAGRRKRYRLIDQEALLRRLDDPSPAAFRRNYLAMIDEACRTPETLKREAWWTEAVGVGGIAFVGGLEAVLATQERRRNMDREREGDDRWVLRETGPRLGLYAKTRLENSSQEAEKA